MDGCTGIDSLGIRGFLEEMHDPDGLALALASLSGSCN